MGVSLADDLTGIFASYGILAALHARTITGEGQLVETSLLQSMVSFVQENGANYFEDSEVPRRTPDRKVPRPTASSPATACPS